MISGSTRPKVSIVVPVYNAELYLKECLDSLLNQSLSEFEVICVDDQSTDNSVAILDEYEERYEQLSVFHRSKSNAGEARNYGLSVARGEYIIFVDADDFCEPEMMERLYETAKMRDADVVVCETKCYSELTHEYSVPSYMVRDELIPKTRDSCFNYSDCTESIFQLFGMALWNKLLRLDMLIQAGVQAQSLPAANDVLMTASALVLAERITVVHEKLYVQRKDCSSSITARLDEGSKWSCGYRSSLALKHFLESRGLYSVVKKSYRKLALHSVVWYLDKVQDKDRRLFSEYYNLLRNSWLRDLDLIDLERSDALNAYDFSRYLTLIYKTLEENLYEQIDALKKESWKKGKELARIKKSRDYRLGKAILKYPKKIRSQQKTLASKKKVKQADRQELSLRKKAQKRICIVAYETYHYSVVANTIKLANCNNNYVEVFIGKVAADEVKSLLGIDDPGIKWHVYPKKQKWENCTRVGIDNWRLAISEKVADRSELDLVILISPEYQPQNYEQILNAHNRSYKLVAMVHNVNRVFAPDNKDSAAKNALATADAYAVLDSALAKTIADRKLTTKRVYLLPLAFDFTAIENRRPCGRIVSFVITGSVERERKDYDSLIRALGMIPEHYHKIRIILLGKTSSAYGRKVVEALRGYAEHGLDVVSYSDFVPSASFEAHMNESDCILGPVQIHTKNEHFDEVYGKTKVSGVVCDMVQYALPGIVPSDLTMPEELHGSYIKYSDDSELANSIVEMLDPDARKTYRDAASENSMKFDLASIRSLSGLF